MNLSLGNSTLIEMESVSDSVSEPQTKRGSGSDSVVGNEADRNDLAMETGNDSELEENFESGSCEDEVNSDDDSSVEPVRDFYNFLVGGMSYCLLMEDIRKYWRSYFNVVIKKKWSPDPDAPIKIDRDGRLFRYIVEFHHHGELPFKSKKVSLDLVKQIQVEADFYNLPALVKACEKYVISCVGDYLHGDRNITCKYGSADKDDLINVVSATWAPFCISGSIQFRNDCTIFKSSTLLSLNIDELCGAATPAPFGKGSESLIDPAVRDALEISADKLNPELWEEFPEYKYGLHELAPRMNLELRPYKLVIYKEGGHFTEHRDSVRGEGHIGTLVHILNSKFTGGKLVVRQNDTEEYIDRPGQWIAMYGDALHRIEPVISGTRVALIFDLYNVGAVRERDYFEEAERFGDPAADRLLYEGGEEMRNKIYAGLDKELKNYEAVVICLTHLYPVCQADPACLKGGDALLYQLLALRERDYDVDIVPVKVNQSIDRSGIMESFYSGALVDLEYEVSKQFRNNRETPKTLLVIPVQCTSNHVLSYSEFIEHVGNEPQAEKTMYLVTGFRITRHIAVVEEPSEESAHEGLKRANENDSGEGAAKKVALG